MTTTKKQIPEDGKKIRVLQSGLAKDTKANKAWTMILQVRKEFAGIDKLEEKLKIAEKDRREIEKQIADVVHGMSPKNVANLAMKGWDGDDES